jgi:hypothetical protein
MELDSELQQVSCCRYLRANSYDAGETIFEEGSLAYNIFHILGKKTTNALSSLSDQRNMTRVTKGSGGQWNNTVLVYIM